MPVAEAETYVVCVGSFRDFYGVLLEPGGEGSPRSLWNAVNFVEVARGQPGVTVSVEYSRDAGQAADSARGDGARGDGARGDGARGDGARGDGARGDGARDGTQYEAECADDIETMSEWLLVRANGLLHACDNFGSGRAESTSEINAEAARIDGQCRELARVGDLVRDREALQETLFCDDPCGLLDLALSTNERVRLSLELFRTRKTELALAHRAVNHILARDFHIAILYRYGSDLKGEERVGVLRGFQRALAKHSAQKASRRYAEIKATPLDRGALPGPEGGIGNEMTAYARLLDPTAVSDDFVTDACGDLSDSMRAALAGVVERIFGNFAA